jgi:hypothetical protein
VGGDGRTLSCSVQGGTTPARVEDVPVRADLVLSLHALRVAPPNGGVGKIWTGADEVADAAAMHT